MTDCNGLVKRGLWDDSVPGQAGHPCLAEQLGLTARADQAQNLAEQLSLTVPADQAQNLAEQLSLTAPADRA